MTDRRTGDTKPDLAGVHLTDLNAVGTTVLIHVKRPDATLISRAPVVPAGTTGAWTLAFLVGELDTAGAYHYESESTDADGSVQTTRYGGFRVRAQLDGGDPTYVAPFTIVDNLDGTSTLTWS